MTSYYELQNILGRMQKEVYEVNFANGWFDTQATVLERHMLIVTEVAEATEAWRKWGLADATAERVPDNWGGGPIKPEGVGSEYADILIRLLDACQSDEIDLAYEYTRKLAYNRTRGYRHGGKKL